MSLRLRVLYILAGVAAGCGARADVASGSSVIVEAKPPIVPAEDACNGIDDDLDGFVDEDPVTAECGAGACRTVGTCVDGAILCDPKPPAKEICNGIDDDCDGSIDDDLGFESLGPPSVLWSEPGGLVFGADLVRVGEAFLVAFQKKMEGPPPFGPNQRTLRVGLDGAVLGPVVDLDTRFCVWGPRVSLGPEDRVAIASCGLDGHGYFGYSALADGATGDLVGRDARRSPADRSCGAMAPDGFFVGNHYVYGWVENSSNTDGTEVILDVSDAALKSLKTTVLTDEGDLAVPPRFAAHDERLAVSYGLRGYPNDSVLRVQVFRDPLAEMPEPTDLPAPEGQHWGETQILPSESGFILLGDNRFDAGLFRAAVDLRGAILEPITAIEGFDEKYSALHSTSRPGGAFAMTAAVTDKNGRTVVMALDAKGHVTSTVEERWLALPRAALGLDDGRVAVLFTEETSKDENKLVIEFYGCAP